MKNIALIFLSIISFCQFSFGQANIQPEDLQGKWFQHVLTSSEEFFLHRNQAMSSQTTTTTVLEFKADGTLHITAIPSKRDPRDWCGTMPPIISTSQPQPSINLEEPLQENSIRQKGTWEIVDNDTIIIRLVQDESLVEIKWRVENLNKEAEIIQFAVVK